MNIYAITACVERETDGGKSMRQIPTFYLHPNVQGIVSEQHACEIAYSIIDPFGDIAQVHVTAVLIPL